jgi:hypothetical protein
MSTVKFFACLRLTPLQAAICLSWALSSSLIPTALAADRFTEAVRIEAPTVSLSNLVTESNPENFGNNRSQITFTLSIKVPAHSQSVTPKLSHHNLFKVTDSQGNIYPIADVTPKLKQLQPGQEYQLSVQVEGSSAAQLAGAMQVLHLEIDAAVFGSNETLRFIRRADVTTNVRNPRLR